MKRTTTAIKKRNRDGLLYVPGETPLVPVHQVDEQVGGRPLLKVVLIGCGGTGSQMLTGLGQIHASLQAMHAQGATVIRATSLDVEVFDPDTVSPFNVGRQLFYEPDIGQYKAEVLVNRVNMAYGTRWRGNVSSFQEGFASRMWRDCDIVITCTDTASSRREIHKILWETPQSSKPKYWLDCANLATVGQVVLGQPGHEQEDQWPRNKVFDPGYAIWKGQRKKQIAHRTANMNAFVVEDRCYVRLPCVTELFPDLMDESFDETNEPSCSMVDALKKQSLFVNRTVSAYALDLLWELLRDGQVTNQGCYFNLRNRTAQPIDFKVWPVAPKRYVAAEDGRRKRAEKVSGTALVN